MAREMNKIYVYFKFGRQPNEKFIGQIKNHLCLALFGETIQTIINGQKICVIYVLCSYLLSKYMKCAQKFRHFSNYLFSHLFSYAYGYISRERMHHCFS